MNGQSMNPAGGADALGELVNPLPCDPSAATLVDLLRQAAREEAGRPFIDFINTRNEERWVTFGAVQAAAERWAALLLDHGIKRADRVVLLLPSGEAFLGALFGTLLAGGTPVPCAFPVGPGDASAYVLGLAPIVADAGADLLITLDQYRDPAKRLLAERPARDRAVLIADRIDLSSSPRTPLPELDGGDLALLQYASGPVGRPAGVALTHHQLLSNIEALGQALQLSDRDVAVNWIPLVHDMGLVGGLLTSLYWRCQLHVMPPQLFLMHPHLWLANISRFRATLSVAPNGAYQICVRRVRDKHLQQLDLSSWRAAINGGETVHPSTVDAFSARFAEVGFESRAILPTYGLAENTLATTCPALGEPPHVEPLPAAADGQRGVVSLGRPLPGQQLAVIDERGDRLQQRQIGEVVVRGPCTMQGYWRRPRASARALADGWLHTGDLGFIQAGRLFITGRRRPMVIKLGRNFFFADIERAVESVVGDRGVAAAAARANDVSGTDDLLVAVSCALLDDTDAERRALTEINAALLGSLGLRADEIVLVRDPGDPTSVLDDPNQLRQQLRQQLCQRFNLAGAR